MWHIRDDIKYVLYPLFFLFFSKMLLASGGKYPIQNFTSLEYKAGIQNIDFAQNRDMTIFVANNLCVLSYNGENWKDHPVIAGKKKRSLAFDEDSQRLYVGAQGDFGYFEDNWNYTSLQDKIPDSEKDFDEVWDVFIINRNVYFCTFRAIYVYDGQSIELIKDPKGLGRSFKADHVLFTQNNKGELLEVKNNRLNFTYPQTEKTTISGVVPYKNGYLVFYHSGRIELTSAYGVKTVYAQLSEALKNTFVNHVLKLSDNRLAISTQTSGLFLFDLENEVLENITTADGLETNACLRSFQDYDGNLWVGMQDGIALIHINSPMRLISQDVGIQGSGYDAFDLSSGQYYTTSNGIYFLPKNTQKSIFLEGTEGPAYGMEEVAGKLYAGHHTGLFQLENGKARRVASTNGLWKIIKLRSHPNHVIGGTYDGLYLFRLNKNQDLEAVGKIKGFDESSRFFEEDHLGRIWVGQYYKGIFQLTLSKDLSETQVINLSTLENSPINEQVILGKIDDKIYIGTQQGMLMYNPTEDRIIPVENFLKSIGKQPIYLFKQDKLKNVHVVTEKTVGFFRQKSANNYVFLPSSLLMLRYHLNNDLMDASVKIDEGILFSANKGFIHYLPSQEEKANINKIPIISRIYNVSQDSLLYALNPFEPQPDQAKKLVIGEQAKVLQFEVESFRFADVNHQQFRYFMKGFDEDYGKWTSTTKKEYTNLKEGTYEFFVQSIDCLGQITTSQPLVLTVKPPLYRSMLAKVLYAVMALLLVFLIPRLQKRKYKQEIKHLEEKKQHEIKEKQQKFQEIEVKKEQEVLQLKEEKVQSELRHVNNLLAASTMNLVVKNEFIEGIKEQLNDVKKKGKNQETKRALEQIVKEIDKTLRLQEDWAQFKHHFDRVHGDFLSRLRDEFIDLTPNDQKLCAFLRLNLNTKEIANLMSISLRGVEVARYRLRKKLRLQKGQNLSKFILEY